MQQLKKTHGEAEDSFNSRESDVTEQKREKLENKDFKSLVQTN